jgi:hypothetical protein
MEKIMAAMSTSLTEFSTLGDSRVYTYGTHTALAPKMVLQRRKVPSGNQVVAEDVITVLASTVDADGNILAPRVSFSATVRRPITGDVDDITAALAIFRDVIAGDEFGNTVSTQEFLK